MMSSVIWRVVYCQARVNSVKVATSDRSSVCRFLDRREDFFPILELDSAPHESDEMRGIHSSPSLLCRECKFEG